MDRLGRWLWRRHRRHLVVAVGLTTTALLSALLIAPAVAVGAVYLGMTLPGALAWAASTLVAIAVGLVLGTLVIRRRFPVLHAWDTGEIPDVEAAWRALVQLPQAMGRVVLGVVLPLATAASLPVALAVTDMSAPGLAGVLYAYALVTVAGHALTMAVTQLLVRPAVAELAAGVAPEDVGETQTWTIRRRLVVGAFVGSSFAAVSVPLAVYGTAPSEGDYLAFLVLGGLFALYVCFLLDLGMFQPTLAPVRDLVEGMVRVRRGDLDEPVPVTSPDEVGTLAAAFNEMQRGLRQRQALHAAFGSYVDPVLAERLLTSGSSVFEGEEVEVTVLFADVRDFTSFSEGVEPAEAVALLNRLFEVIVPRLHDHGGHANHYLGDGLLAIFGAPNPLERHADAALAAATDIQRAVHAELGDRLRLGIGINTGPVIAGTVGGGGRHEFTVIGDTVNVAARVEQLTKETGDAILVTEMTRAALSPPRPRMAKRGAFELKGKFAAVVIHAVNPFPRSTG